MYSHLNHSAKFGLQLLRGIVLFVAFTFDGSISQAQIKIEFTSCTMYFADDGVGINWYIPQSKLDDQTRKAAKQTILYCNEENASKLRIADQKPYDETDWKRFHFFDKRTMIVGQMIHYEIQIQDKDGKALLTYPLEVTIPKPLPYTPTPTGLKVELIKEGEKCFLIWTWDKAKDEDQITDAYRLYYRRDNQTGSESLYEKIPRSKTTHKQEIHESMDDIWHCHVKAVPKEFTHHARTSLPSELIKVFIPGSFVDRVKNFKATHDYTKPGIVTLTWEHEHPQRLKGFQIYDQDQQLVNEEQCPANQTLWVFNDVPINTLHHYNVKAVTKYGYVSYKNTGVVGQVLVSDTPPGSEPRRPENLSYQWIENQPGKVLINWDQTQDAVKYLVQSAISKRNSYREKDISNPISTQKTQHTFELDPTQEHYVFVKGVDQYDRQGDRAYLMILQPGIYYGAPYFSIKTTRNEDGTKTYKLHWRLLPKDINHEQLAGFELSCNDKTIAGPDVQKADVMEYILSSNTLAKGQHNYTVRAIQMDGRKCKWSDNYSIRIR